ncbi:septum formation protein Maf [Roseivivax halodurans JCM 10272]|uniref:Nucleoside triphosphate pyrophosphatase n=1 Tax=Roseivivax halodurans JCM 10272 TaxID=1449350 RepID=X7EL84_9RHOB|nr:Maf family protein [Roseivivax halodurans]ETX15906.1 septum formation protein Maf [Roseivivax halodurans JCM 10272]
MTEVLTLASGSKIRSELLSKARIDHRIEPARVDEEAVRESLDAEGASPRDLADALAEMKARKVAGRGMPGLVLGCDQVLAFGEEVFSKPEAREEAAEQIRRLRGERHQLLSAAVLYEDGAPVWRHVGTARLYMRDVSDDFLEGYLDRNWPDIGESVGGYKLEAEGVRLFTRIEGDHFTILGLPLLQLIDYLVLKGVLPS